jgi:hypothetical protein
MIGLATDGYQRTYSGIKTIPDARQGEVII